jgi:hypothetical protein
MTGHQGGKCILIAVDHETAQQFAVGGTSCAAKQPAQLANDLAELPFRHAPNLPWDNRGNHSLLDYSQEDGARVQIFFNSKGCNTSKIERTFSVETVKAAP